VDISTFTEVPTLRLNACQKLKLTEDIPMVLKTGVSIVVLFAPAAMANFGSPLSYKTPLNVFGFVRFHGVLSWLSALASILCGPPFSVALHPPELSSDALLKSSTPEKEVG